MPALYISGEYEKTLASWRGLFRRRGFGRTWGVVDQPTAMTRPCQVVLRNLHNAIALCSRGIELPSAKVNGLTVP